MPSMTRARDARVIPLPSLDVMFSTAGVPPVDMDAVKALGRILEQVADAIVENAMLLAGHAGRVTITKADIVLGYEHWNKARGLP